MMTKIRQRLNQKGFTLVELMVVIAILGILAAIAIPKFSDSTSAANTAKIAADLRTIDSAIVMFQANGGTLSGTNVSQLSSYLVGTDTLVPPTGKCYIGTSTAETVPTGGYTIDVDAGRAILGAGNTADKFHK